MLLFSLLYRHTSTHTGRQLNLWLGALWNLIQSLEAVSRTIGKKVKGEGTKARMGEGHPEVHQEYELGIWDTVDSKASGITFPFFSARTRWCVHNWTCGVSSQLSYVEVAMLRKDLTGFMYYSVWTKITVIQVNAGRFIILIGRKVPVSSSFLSLLCRLD